VVHALSISVSAAVRCACLLLPQRASIHPHFKEHPCKQSLNRFDMSHSDENLTSLLLKLSESSQVAAVLGKTLELKLQPWLRSPAACQDMLRCR
jgi:hypothetical protein